MDKSSSKRPTPEGPTPQASHVPESSQSQAVAKQGAMSGPPPPHQLIISDTSATNGAQAFAGVVHGNVYYGAPETNKPQAPPKPASTVPFRRDPDFVDRGNLLSRVNERCSQPAGRAALVGLGGVGKSQLAIEYAHRVRERSKDTWVFWVHASNAARVEESYKGIADKLMLPGRHEKMVNVLALVVGWLSDEGNGQWLMIVDNADEFGTVQPQYLGPGEEVSMASLLPQSNNGAILITSRNVDVAREMTGRDQDIINVETMNQHEAATLLKNKLVGPPDNGMADLLAALEYFPLAITQAAAYINRRKSRTSASDYLRKLEFSEQKAWLLQKSISDMRRDEKASNSILATWKISFEQIRSERPTAADLLAFMSFFNRQGIPEFVVRYYKDTTGRIPEGGDILDTLSQEAEEEFEEDMALLCDFSLVATTDNQSEFEMHGLVQFATRVWLSSTGVEEEWREKFVAAMAASYPTAEYENWAICRALLPHVQSISDGQPSPQHTDEWVRVLTNASLYAWRQGLLSKAEDFIQKSLNGCEEGFGVDDPRTLANFSILSSVWGSQGRYKKAEDMNRRALAGREVKLGGGHLSTLTSMSNLALVLRYRGKYSEAEAMNRRALAGFEKKLGDEHPSTLTSVSNLALVLGYQGQPLEAEAMSRRALAGREKILGLDHPDTLTSISNLATALQYQGKYDEAEKMSRRALVGREKKLGHNHPNTLTSVDNLAVVLRYQGKYKEAEVTNRRALAEREKELGSDHPDTLMSVNNLAVVLQYQGKYLEAEAMNRRVLAGRRKKLGLDHPETLTSMSNLAVALRFQEKYEEAEEMNWTLLVERERKLGSDHPDTLTSMGNLAIALQYQGKYEEAEKMNRRALVGREKKLGDDHPDTLTSVYCLAYLLATIDRHDEAACLYKRARAGLECRLGASHPITVACRPHSFDAYGNAVHQLEQKPSQCLNMEPGPKAARISQNYSPTNKPDTLPLEIDPLTPLDENDVPGVPGVSQCRTQCTVTGNCTHEQTSTATGNWTIEQVSVTDRPVEDPWEKISCLEITNNVGGNSSVMINYGSSVDVFERLLDDRVSKVRLEKQGK